MAAPKKAAPATVSGPAWVEPPVVKLEEADQPAKPTGPALTNRHIALEHAVRITAAVNAYTHTLQAARAFEAYLNGGDQV